MKPYGMLYVFHMVCFGLPYEAIWTSYIFHMGFLCIPLDFPTPPHWISFGLPGYSIWNHMDFPLDVPGLPFGSPMKPYGIPTNSIWNHVGIPYVSPWGFLWTPWTPLGVSLWMSYEIMRYPRDPPTNSIWYACCPPYEYIITQNESKSNPGKSTQVCPVLLWPFWLFYPDGTNSNNRNF